MRLLAIGLPVPDQPPGLWVAGSEPSTFWSRRAASDVDSTGLKLRGAGEWLFEKHGASKRRSWRKLHIGIIGGGAYDRAHVLDAV
jgi:hypothetical protein